jgi:hypothetical protein
MLPIATVFQNISKVHSTQTKLPVRLPTAAEINQKREQALSMGRPVEVTASADPVDKPPVTISEKCSEREDIILPVLSNESPTPTPANTPRWGIAQRRQNGLSVQNFHPKEKPTTSFGGAGVFASIMTNLPFPV